MANAHVCGYRIIITTHVYPPIPDRRFDWCATFSDYDEGSPVGYGATEQAAIDDLHENAEADAEFNAWRASPEGVAYYATGAR